jgi:hypothetical protein
VEVVALDIQLAKFLCGDLLAGGIFATVEPRAYDEPAAVGRVSDEADDRFVGSAELCQDPRTLARFVLGAACR